MAYDVLKIESAEDAEWDAADWCWTVMQGDDTVCICATKEEADHIAALLNEKPYAPTTTG